MNGRFEETDTVGFWKRVGMTLLDIMILVVPNLLLYKWSHSLVETFHSEIPIVIRWAVIFGFNLFMVIKFGGTPGKLLLKARIVNGQGNYPNLKEALIRNCLYILSVIFSIIFEISQYDYTSFSRYISLWADLASDLSGILGFVLLADCLIIALSRENQALHDLMAGTYVVNKDALDAKE